MSKFSGPIGIASSNPFVCDEANPTHELGEKIYTPDGRAFRYVLNGAGALTAGTLIQSPAESTANQSRLVAAAAIGATTVTTTDTVTVTANQYAGGWLIGTGEGGTGNGIAYRIASHPAATAAVCTFTLEDPLQVAFTTATQIDLVQNPYRSVIVNPTTASGTVVGVAVNNISASQYGWIQTEGVAPVLNDASGATTVGVTVTASNQTAGSVEDGDTDTQAVVGYCVTGGAANEYSAVKLNIGG
ncbi:MAG: hypothetical protein VKN72_04715 [Nostocales cyanobacterium 94392]|nr:hypothetical protein [Nostocales cyanobacterium 94392]